jgi:oxygen-independent coproporphyrinogen-3 oxidase
VLETAQLERIFAAVRQEFEIDKNAEVTVECAPGTLTPQVVDSLLRCGVNRVSLGVQSFVDAEAAAVGRLHKRSIVLQDIARLRASGIANISIDLIAGLPHQTAFSWNYSLMETIATGVPHVSVYMLEVDEESRLGRELLAGGTRYHAHFVPDDEATTDFYLAACEHLDAAGIAQYEISNFARSGFDSRHNLKYWTRQPYLGFGVDAHSMLPANREEHDPSTSLRTSFSRADKSQANDSGFSPCGGVDAVRFATPDSLERYTASAPMQQNPVTATDALEESFFLGLRLNRGVHLREIAGKFVEPATKEFEGVVTDLVNNDLLTRDGDRIRLTPRGRLLSNEVFERFLATADIVR